MKSSSISIQFVVNDLNANYEVIGTSDNYSFQYKLGKGSDLVDSLGGIATKIVSLKGNYGVFEVKIFAVSDIGIRSDCISESITISPPTFDQTFTFNNLRISDLRGAVVDSLFVEKSPAEPGDDLIVSQQFAGKDMEVLWELIPPVGHALEGQSVSTELLSDTLFSGFIVNIKSDDQVIDVSSYDDQNSAIQSFSSQFNTNPNNVAQDLSGFRNFSLTLDRNVFDGFDLSRNTSLEIVAVDSFGRTATGTISGNNPALFLNNLTSSLNGSQMSFSWAVDSIDYSGMNINVLGIPENRELFDSGDLTLSKNFIEDINRTISNNLTWNNNFNYNSGDLVARDGDVFRSNIDHTSSYNNAPQNDSATWTNYGQSIDYVFQQESLGTLSFNQEQFFGYKYYYTFQAFDDFGPGDLFLLSEGGSLSVQGEEDSLLFPFQSEIRIANLRYFEREDDLVFNWDIVDQDGNAVDLVQYRAAFKEGGLPAILGLSGSLYDVHTNQIITGLTEGNNSISLTKNEDGDTELVYGLQTSKIFNTYEYTREINNSIYGTGGFPSIYESFDYTKNYNSGDHVIDDDQNVYKAILETSNEDPKIKPVYDQWQKDVDYVVGESFYYQGVVYKVDQNFGPQYTEGLFDFSRTYVAGDLVIAPNQYFEYFDVNNQYQLNDLVVYNSTLYKCLAFQEASSAVVPGTDSTKWRVASLFSEVDCNVYKAVSSSQGLIPINETVQEGGVLVDKWQVCYPDNSDKVQSYIQSYSGFVFEWNDIDNFTSGDLAVYANDIWSGIRDSGPDEDSGSVVPGTDSQYWVNQSNGQDIIFSYNSGDIVYNDGTVYKANADDPVGAPIFAVNQPGEDSQSSYQGTEWIPYWQQETQYQSTIFGNIGIPQSGKRSVGIELAIVDREGDIFDTKRLSADNPPPYILTEGFNVDSTSEATKVKFNFNYALGFQEKTTKVYLYRSESPDFDVVDEYGFPLTGENTPFVKSVVGAGDATFGQNITQIIDEPRPDQWDEEGVDQITGYYYKILPFDDFGSGVLYNVPDGSMDKVIVYPKRYNNPNPNVMPGRVLKSNPTSTTDAVPGAIQNLTGSTSFENFFLNWNAPGSNFFDNNTSTDFENDIDHYEVWQSDEPYIKSGQNENATSPWLEAENTGYRKIKGVAYSVGEIPEESLDPARYIYGAKNIFNVAANAPSVEVVHGGKTNETKYFWVRAVDFAGNKSPFSNAANEVNIKGLGLNLGRASATDIAGFEINMTNTFNDAIASIPNNPFSQDGNGGLQWDRHTLFSEGTGYIVEDGSFGSDVGYIWWDKKDENGNLNLSENYYVKTVDGIELYTNQSIDSLIEFEDTDLTNVYFSGVNYSGSNRHPAGSNNQTDKVADFDDGDFIIARNSDGVPTVVHHAFANALIGTANIAEASIINAKINDLSADKITAGQIKGHKIEITHSGGNNSDQYGSIASVGFDGIDYNNPRSGFVLSGDGTFAFQQGAGALTFEDDKLILYGGFRSTRELDFDFVDIDLNPQFFTYHELQDGTFEPADDCPDTINIRTTFRNSRIESTGVRFKMEAVSGNQRYDVFGYDDHDANGNYNNISGFTYAGDFSEGIEQKTARATFDLTGFSGILEYYDQIADSVVITAKSNKSELERSTTITRVIDGRVGDNGAPGVKTALVYAYQRGSNITSNAGAVTVNLDTGLITTSTLSNGWSKTIPSGSDPLYVIAASASGTGSSDTISSGEWSSPEILSQNGLDGLNSATVFIYKRTSTSSTPSSLPTGDTTYTFLDGSAVFTDPKGWSRDIPSSGGPYLWISQATASSKSTTDTISDSEWATSKLLSQDGAPGVKTALVYAYQRGSNITSNAGAVTVNLDTGLITTSTLSNGWSKTIPSGSDPLYVIAASASGTGSSDTISSGEWSSPEILSQNGLDGLNSATVFIYKRTSTSSAPSSLPTGDTTYTFSDGSAVFTDPKGWSRDIPSSGGPYLWISQATASSKSTTDTITDSEWATSKLLSQDGANGNNGATPTFRGIWNDQTDYTFIQGSTTKADRGDIVQFTGYGSIKADQYNKYYIAKSNSGPNSPNNIQVPYDVNNGGLNSTYWLEFGDELENVATNLLLTEEAIITEKLTMGVGGSATEVPHSGIIVSSDFVGGLFDSNSYRRLPDYEGYILYDENLNNYYENPAETWDYDQDGFSEPVQSQTKEKFGESHWTLLGRSEGRQAPPDEDYSVPGFLLARTDDGVIFDVGGTGIAGQTGYIRFDSIRGKLEIAGSFINNTVINEDAFLVDGSFDNFNALDNLTSFIGGGYNNKLVTNNPDEQFKFYENLGSAILGGAWNEMNSRFSAIAGGYSGYCADNFSFIGGGYRNTMPLEEPGDHQGANFIGCGVDNQINGGASQTIVNGVRNTIEGLTGDYIPVFDRDNGLFSKRILGRYEGGVLTYENIAFHENDYGWTSIGSGVWFPAGIDLNYHQIADSSSINDYYTNSFNKSLYIGVVDSLALGNWVYHEDFKWMYVRVDFESKLYSNETLDYVYAYFAEGNEDTAGWYRFSRVGAQTDYIKTEYGNNFSLSRFFKMDNSILKYSDDNPPVNWNSAF